jgi:phage tail sheath protein FI
VRGARIIAVPEYLAPGVYVEETSYRSKSIEGVSTSTHDFVESIRRSVEATAKIASIVMAGVLLGTTASIAGDKARRRRRRPPFLSSLLSWAAKP